MAFSQRSIVLRASPLAVTGHWLDEPLAMSFLRRAVADVSPGTRASLEGGTYAQQVAGVTQAFADIGKFYQAVNLPPQSDPLYVDAFRRWFGTALGDLTQPAWSRLNGVGLSKAFPGILPSVRNRFSADERRSTGQVFRDRIQANWTRAKGAGHVAVVGDVVLRLELDQMGVVLSQCLAGRNGSGWCDFSEGTPFIGCIQDGASAEGCSSYNWHTMMWNDSPFGPVEGTLPGDHIQHVLAPLSWFYDFITEVITAIAARSTTLNPGPVMGALEQAATYIVIANLTETQRLTAENPANRTVTTGDLANLTASYNLNMSATEAGLQAQAAATAATAASAVTAVVATAFAVAALAAGSTGIGAPVGVIIGIIGAIATAIAHFAPVAIGTETDIFGRPAPLFLMFTMSADPENNGAPTHPLPTTAPYLVPDSLRRLQASYLQRPMPNMRLPMVTQQRSTAAGGGIGTLVVGGAILGGLWFLLKKRRR